MQYPISPRPRRLRREGTLPASLYQLRSFTIVTHFLESHRKPDLATKLPQLPLRPDRSELSERRTHGLGHSLARQGLSVLEISTRNFNGYFPHFAHTSMYAIFHTG